MEGWHRLLFTGVLAYRDRQAGASCCHGASRVCPLGPHQRADGTLVERWHADNGFPALKWGPGLGGPPGSLGELGETRIADALTAAGAQVLQAGAALAEQGEGSVAELRTAAEVQVCQAAPLPDQGPQPAVRQLVAA